MRSYNARVSQRKIIWFAITASTFIYAAVVYSLSRTWPHPGSFDVVARGPYVLGLYAAALVMFVLAFIIPSGIAQHQPRFVARMGLFESCAVLGLMASFLTQDWRVYFAPWALALIGFVRSYPSE
jgi:hypothetical protein